MRNAILFALVLAVVSVTSLNHYTTQTHLRYFEDVQLRDTRELVRMKATEDAQIMATEALIVASVQAGQIETLDLRLKETEDFAMYMLRVANAQKAYIGALIEAMDANGIAPPGPPVIPEPEEKVEEKPLVASSKTSPRL